MKRFCNRELKFCKKLQLKVFWANYTAAGDIWALFLKKKKIKMKLLINEVGTYG